MSDPHNLFPLVLKLAGRSALVVGAGPIAESKVESLMSCGAVVRVVAPEATAKITAWANTGDIVWEARPFRADDLQDVFLVIVATSSPDLNHAIARLAKRLGILCNVVDDPEHCDFYYPAVVRRGQLQIAISTGGQSPALAQRLRQELEQQFGPGYGPWVEHLGKTRGRLLAWPIDPERRRRALHKAATDHAFTRFLRRQGPGSKAAGGTKQEK